MRKMNFRREEEIGVKLRNMAALAGLRPSVVIRVLVDNAPPPEDLRLLSKRHGLAGGQPDADRQKDTCAVPAYQGTNGASVAANL